MKKFLKWLLIIILTLTVVGAAGFAVYYFTYLKPRVDIGIALVDFFSSEEKTDTSTFLTRNGTGVSLTALGDEGDVTVWVTEKDIAVMHYSDDGLTVSTPVSDSAYFIPWADDVAEEIASSPVVDLIGLSENTQKFIADTLVTIRKKVMDKTEAQEIPVINKALKLDTVSVDIRDILKEFEFTFKGEETITVNGEEHTCQVTDVYVPQDMVKQVLGMDMFNGFINTLGQVFSDADVTVYIENGRLICMSVDTDFLYLPDLDNIDYSELLKGDTSVISFKRLPITLSFSKEDDQVVIETKCSPYAVDVDVEILYSREYHGGSSIDTDSEIDIFKMKKLRLILEAAKWKEYIDGQSAD